MNSAPRASAVPSCVMLLAQSKEAWKKFQRSGKDKHYSIISSLCAMTAYLMLILQAHYVQWNPDVERERTLACRVCCEALMHSRLDEQS